MLLNSCVSRITNWKPFRKTGSIATSPCPWRNGFASILLDADTPSCQEQWKVRHASGLASKSKIQVTRYPEPLPFSEIHQAIFGDSGLQQDTRFLPKEDTTLGSPDLSSFVGRDVGFQKVNGVRAGLLKRYPNYTDAQQRFHFASIVEDLGSGGPLELRRRRLRTYNAALIRILNQGHGLTPYMAIQGLTYALSARSSRGVASYLDWSKTANFYFNSKKMTKVIAMFYQRLVTDTHPAEALRQLLDAASIQSSSASASGALFGVKGLSKILGAFQVRIGADPRNGIEGVWPMLSELLRDALQLVRSGHAIRFDGSWNSIIDDSLLMARHSGVHGALYDTWLLFKASPLMEIVEPQIRKSALTDSPFDKREVEWRSIQTHSTRKTWLFNPLIPNRIIQLLVQHFVDLGQVSQAWKVVQESNASRDMLSNSTWSLLLDYPQELPAWDDSMQQVILAKYEEMVLKIENAMGIEWHGGEDGWHRKSRSQLAEESFFLGSEADDLFNIHDGQRSGPFDQDHRPSSKRIKTRRV